MISLSIAAGLCLAWAVLVIILHSNWYSSKQISKANAEKRDKTYHKHVPPPPPPLDEPLPPLDKDPVVSMAAKMTILRRQRPLELDYQRMAHLVVTKWDLSEDHPIALTTEGPGMTDLNELPYHTPDDLMKALAQLRTKIVSMSHLGVQEDYLKSWTEGRIKSVRLIKNLIEVKDD